MSDSNESSWTYIKIYFGTQAERADNFIVDLAQRMQSNAAVLKWFYLRYVDETGFHVRLRYVARPDRQDEANRSVRADCTDMLNHMYEYLPSTYRPMVSLPEFITRDIAPVVDPRLRLEDDKYVPEYEKYGRAVAMPIAENLFHASSEIAGQILADEAAGLYTRKAVAGWLMNEPNEAFPTVVHADYWRQYSLYWLGGDSPAAGDWRLRFTRKGAELRDRGQPVLPDESALPAEAVAVIERWRRSLAIAARDYAALKDRGGARPDVLSLNFSHLMMNRLGIATLEEAYLAALLESAQAIPMQEAVA